MKCIYCYVTETLRLYGAAHNISRICTQPYRIPDSDLVVEKGMRIMIPLYSIHHDPQYYPDPYEFKPERFVPEETRKRHSFVYMPFGQGPRNCIGEFPVLVILTQTLSLSGSLYICKATTLIIPIWRKITILHDI